MPSNSSIMLLFIHIVFQEYKSNFGALSLKKTHKGWNSQSVKLQSHHTHIDKVKTPQKAQVNMNIPPALLNVLSGWTISVIKSSNATKSRKGEETNMTALYWTSSLMFTYINKNHLFEELHESTNLSPKIEAVLPMFK